MEDLSKIISYANGAKLFLTCHATAKRVSEKWDGTHPLFVLSLVSSPCTTKATEHCVYVLDDSPSTRIINIFPKCGQILDRWLSQPNATVIVHCYAGISRSSSTVISYLMCKHKISLSSTFRYVQKKRPVVNPNTGFMEQLQLWDQGITEMVYHRPID